MQAVTAEECSLRCEETVFLRTERRCFARRLDPAFAVKSKIRTGSDGFAEKITP
jgi:hypothetical protein